MLGADALMNNLVKVAHPTVPRWLRPHKRFVSQNMFRQWRFTPDLQKIQRVVACGNFVRIRALPQQTPFSAIRSNALESRLLQSRCSQGGVTEWVPFNY